jgi:hypothetical protein
VKSKWLDWKPKASSVGFVGSVPVFFPIIRASEGEGVPVPALSPDKVIGKTSQGEPTKPTKPISTGHSEPGVERPSGFWGKCSDAYGWRLGIALDSICKVDAPEGLLFWLDQHSPFLYLKLTSSLPDGISRAWDSHIPYEGFDALCLDLVDTYRRAADLYRMVERNGQRDTDKTNS